ncbi:MAG: ubiquitin-like domain-containing protein [Anaerolineales bacterium]
MSKFRLPILVAIGLTGAIILLLMIPRSRTVTILVEGQPVTVTTSARRVADILDEAGFPLGEADAVSPAADQRVGDGDTITLAQASRITIQADGETTSFYSTERTPTAWLAESGLTLAPADRLVVNGQEISPEKQMLYQPRLNVEIRRAVTISLESAGRLWTIQSSAPTLGRALWDAGFQLSSSDVLTPDPETPLTGDLSAVLVPGRQIQITASGETINAVTSADTVGEALAQAGFSLQGLDYSIPDEDAPLPEDGSIRIVRVVEEVVINQEAIPFQTLYELLPEVEIDNYQVAQLGQVGIKAQRLRIRMEDNQEVSRQVEDEWTLREPVDRIEGYGTKIVVRTEVIGGETIEYWRKVNMWATSYSPCNSGASRCYPYTSLGLPVKQGVVAVIYDWFIPMGNHTVYVPGYGHAIIADVGGGVPGRHWIDLGYSDEDYIPWAQWVTVYFTTPIPPENEILYVLPYK